MDDTENTEGMKKIDQNHGFYKPIILEEKHFDVGTISYAWFTDLGIYWRNIYPE